VYRRVGTLKWRILADCTEGSVQKIQKKLSVPLVRYTKNYGNNKDSNVPTLRYTRKKGDCDCTDPMRYLDSGIYNKELESEISKNTGYSFSESKRGLW
jgi:hypothetical protein